MKIEFFENSNELSFIFQYELMKETQSGNNFYDIRNEMNYAVYFSSAEL